MQPIALHLNGASRILYNHRSLFEIYLIR